MASLNDLASIVHARADAELNAAANASDHPTGHNNPPALDVAYSIAMRLGRLRAAGENAVTQLAFGFQRMVVAGDLTEAHGEALYVRHVQGHNAWIAAHPEMGKEPMTEVP